MRIASAGGNNRNATYRGADYSPEVLVLYRKRTSAEESGGEHGALALSIQKSGWGKLELGSTFYGLIPPFLAILSLAHRTVQARPKRTVVRGHCPKYARRLRKFLKQRFR